MLFYHLKTPPSLSKNGEVLYARPYKNRGDLMPKQTHQTPKTAKLSIFPHAILCLFFIMGSVT